MPDLNLRYGCWYLGHLERKYAGRRDATDLALAAYNAGQANVDDWIAHTPRGQTVRLRFTATRDYVRDVRATQALYRRAYGLKLNTWGLAPFHGPGPAIHRQPREHDREQPAAQPRQPAEHRHQIAEHRPAPARQPQRLERRDVLEAADEAALLRHRSPTSTVAACSHPRRRALRACCAR